MKLKVECCPGWAKDVCMCGLDMEGHSVYENHAPLSQWDYYECTEECPEKEPQE